MKHINKIIIKKEEYKIKIKCKNPNCKHEWEYKGGSKWYVTCPRCYNKVNISKELKGGSE